LFATRHIRRGARIVEYLGPRHTDETAPFNRYLMEVNGGVVVDGSPMFNVARYANHCCKPNAEIYVSARNRAWIVAKRAIQPGEEITYDYGKDYVKYFIKQCRCQACRGRQ
jgi:SET domain-containing protein